MILVPVFAQRVYNDVLFKSSAIDIDLNAFLKGKYEIKQFYPMKIARGPLSRGGSIIPRMENTRDNMSRTSFVNGAATLLTF